MNWKIYEQNGGTEICTNFGYRIEIFSGLRISLKKQARIQKADSMAIKIYHSM